MRVLFEGGPLDGKMFSVEDSRTTFEACPELPPATLFNEANRHPPKVEETVALAVYKLHRVVNHPANVDAIGEL